MMLLGLQESSFHATNGIYDMAGCGQPRKFHWTNFGNAASTRKTNPKEIPSIRKHFWHATSIKPQVGGGGGGWGTSDVRETPMKMHFYPKSEKLKLNFHEVFTLWGAHP